jgi:uncharacterized delta-60 repeat protein
MATTTPFAYNPSTSFSIGSGFDGDVSSIAIQSDGKILAGGYFDTFTGSSQDGLIRLNSDGSKDTSFNIGSGFVGGVVFNVTTTSDGKIFVGGAFSSFSGSTQRLLAKLNSDGSKDSTFVSGFPSSGGVGPIKIQSDGKILVGGFFTSYSGSSQNHLIRLNSDGSKDTSFNIGTGFAGYGEILTVEIQTDGKILAGGYFTSYSGESQNYLIRLNSDGSKDSSFNIGSGFNSGVSSIVIQSDGKILVGGGFTTFTGSTENKLIRLNSDGSKDTSFNIGSGFDSDVSPIKIQSDGKILVGGYFSTFTGSSQNNLIRLNSNGSKDESFNIGTGFSAESNNNVSSIAIQSDGKILVGGGFTTYSGSSQNRLIKLNSDGSIFSGGAAPSISGTTQVGSLAVGVTQQEYSAMPGGVTWWMGPDEDLGYVIGVSNSVVTHPTPISGVTANLGFFRSTGLTDSSFINLTNTVFNQSFSSATEASIWLTNNGYWNSYITPVLYLDAGNPASYPGSGQVWTDMIGGKVFNLINGAGYDPANGGRIYFYAAGNQYAECSTSLPSLPTFTASIWHYWDGANTGSLPCILTENYVGGALNFTIGAPGGVVAQGGYFNGNFQLSPQFTLTPNNWYNIVTTCDSNQDVRIYLNGTLISTTATSGPTPASSNAGILLMKRWDGSEHWGGYLSTVGIYDKALSTGQVSSIFNTTKSRYGL